MQKTSTALLVAWLLWLTCMPSGFAEPEEEQTFGKHECGFTSKPQNPKAGDTLILSCSIIVNGMWNPSLIFRNDYDGSEIVGETKTCGIQPSRGSKICNSVKLKAETDILAYGCHLKFPTDQISRNSQGTTELNNEVVCRLPTIYLEAIPFDVSFLCNQMPCGETASVGDTVTCVAHGYPQPVFDLLIEDIPGESENESENHENKFFLDSDEDGSGRDSTAVTDSAEVIDSSEVTDSSEVIDSSEVKDSAEVTYSSEVIDSSEVKDSTEVEIKGSEDIRMEATNVGHKRITCNVSNALGWGSGYLDIDVKLGLPESETDLSGPGEPTFRLADYKWKGKRIKLVNYVAAVGSNIRIKSPINPAPIGTRWFSYSSESLLSSDNEVDADGTSNQEDGEFHEPNKSPLEVRINYDDRRRWLTIQKIPTGYADLFRVVVDGSLAGETAFDAVITLMTFEKHECGYESKPSHPQHDDELVLSCSVKVNGLWNASLVFRNVYDGSEVRGNTAECSNRSRTGSHICSTVSIKAESDILSYGCSLEFPSSGRHILSNPVFKNSKWTDNFDKEVVCYLPTVYLEAIPSDVTFLCNNMPCEGKASVNDTVTCVAHGYPQPVFGLHVSGHESKNQKNPSSTVNRDDTILRDRDDEASEIQIRGSENYRIRQADLGQIEITCNVSNSLGWGSNEITLEIESSPSEATENKSGMFRLEEFSDLLKDHKIKLVNYVAEVGTNVRIMSPITPAPAGISWISLKTDVKLISPNASLDSSPSHSVFQFDAKNRWLKVLNVSLDDADEFRVFVTEDVQRFDVMILLVIFENHECGFTSRPQHPKAGDSLLLNCGVVVNGKWNVSLVFYNNYDQSKIVGETRMCGGQPSVGTKVCSEVNVQADADILAYSCRVEFVRSKTQERKPSEDLTSKWTTHFNKVVDCHLPKVYVEVIPSEVSFLCNQMPCEDTASVNDTVTCVAHGYPQPSFDFRVQKLPFDLKDTHEGEEKHLFRDTSDESSVEEIKGSDDYRITQNDVGHINLTCNVSNALGWADNSLSLKVIGVAADEDNAETVRPTEEDNVETVRPTEEDNVEKDDRDSRTFHPEPLTDITISTETADIIEETVTAPDEEGTTSESDEGHLSDSDAVAVQLLCNGMRCDESETLFVGDEISCVGRGNMSFDRIVLEVNGTKRDGDKDGVKYALQMEDVGDNVVECSANNGSGVVLGKTVHITVRGNKPGAGEAAGGIDLEEAETIVKKPPRKPDSLPVPAAGTKDVPKAGNDAMAEEHEGLAEDNNPKPSVGSGRDSFVLLQLLLVFIAAFVGLVQY